MKNSIPIGLMFLAILLLVRCSAYNPLTQALADPENVTTLKIQNVRLDSLPKEIGKLTNLKTLYLFRNKLQKIPDEIGNLKKLENLVISSNNLIEIPDEIGNLSNLVQLNAAYCGTLVRIPETIRFCNKLELLHIDNTMILPHSIINVNSRLRVVTLGKTGVR